LLIAALNGGHAPSSGVPVSPDELAADAAAAVAAGATELHVHPRRPDGAESLHPDHVAAVVEAIGGAVPHVAVSVTTGAWIEPDPRRRIAQVSAWRVLPTSATVNVHEEGAVAVARVLHDHGVAVEAGLFTVTAAEEFVRGPLRSLADRVLVEPVDRPTLLAVQEADTILDLLDRYDVDVPRVLHGDGANTWPVLHRAYQLGLGIRIGLEDTFALPDGSPAPHNAALVGAALAELSSERRWGVAGRS
jgi:uncharacterized protein (DUF849 family)